MHHVEQTANDHNYIFLYVWVLLTNKYKKEVFFGNVLAAVMSQSNCS